MLMFIQYLRGGRDKQDGFVRYPSSGKTGATTGVPNRTVFLWGGGMTEEKFLNGLGTLYVEDPVTGCWEWKRGKYGAEQYGAVWMHGRTHRAHRISYRLFRGIDPGELLVCHTCDNPSCINPDHLWLGTDKDNCLDKIAKGRDPDKHGERNPKAKLTDEDVLQIRKLCRDGMFQKDIAVMFGITQTDVSCIKLGKNWTHVHTEAIIPKSDENGEKNPNARFTEEDIHLIRAFCNEGVSGTIIGKMFGIHRNYVSNIHTGKSWGWLPIDERPLPDLLQYIKEPEGE